MPRTALFQIQPFNRHRFADSLAYLSAAHNRPLRLYEAVKLHVMSDVFHTVRTSKPMIGGFLSPFPNGPVVRSAENQFNAWFARYNETGESPEGFTASENQYGLLIKSAAPPDVDDFSDAEAAATGAAWDAVIPVLDRSWEDSQDFFHRASFIGRAWKSAKNLGTALDWNVILQEYDRENGTTVSSSIGRLLAI